MIAYMDPKRLAEVELFSTLDKKQLEQLAGWTDEVTVPQGEELTVQGRLAHEFFVIEDGAAEVRQDGERIAELGPGDFFGEIGLLETERRTASVIATTPLTVIVMFQSQFRQMEQDMPAVAAQIRDAIASRNR